jgi:hypothetical protein
MPGWLTLRRSRRSGGYYIEQVAETIFTDFAWNVGELEELALAVADGRPAAGSAGLVVAVLEALLALSTVPVISTWCPTCSLSLVLPGAIFNVVADPISAGAVEPDVPTAPVPLLAHFRSDRVNESAESPAFKQPVTVTVFALSRSCEAEG